jgi:hypothetical protein
VIICSRLVELLLALPLLVHLLPRRLDALGYVTTPTPHTPPIFFSLLVCTPLGFVRLFDVVSQFLIKPQFLRDINEEFYACALEEECLRRRLKHVQNTGKYYVSPAPMSMGLNGPFQDDDDYKLPDSLLRLRNGELQSGLGQRLVELESKRKVLGGWWSEKRKSLRRSVRTIIQGVIESCTDILTTSYWLHVK